MVYEHTSLLTSLLQLELDKYKQIFGTYATASVCVSFCKKFPNVNILIFKKNEKW